MTVPAIHLTSGGDKYMINKDNTQHVVKMNKHTITCVQKYITVELTLY
jgi:hypothetical protein